jgi:3'-phosphoadenosine 5'-phosphosulfate sulfotransferase (PAPS reductase)/FAD synthetase
MNNKLAILKSKILKDMEKLEHLFESFELSYNQYKDSQIHAYLVEAAFYVNQIYTGFERIFSDIALTFENTIDEIEWHRSLLEKMTLSIENIRPAVIDEDNFKYCNELRTFRHFFRHGYGQDIDPEKFTIVASRALKLADNYRADIERFIQFIDQSI